MFRDIVVVRGGGDIATGIIQKLHRSGFKVLILELENPMVIRREVSFAQAIFDNEKVIEGIKAIKVDEIEGIKKVWDQNEIPIIIDEKCDILNKLKIDILVDATLAKKNLGVSKDMAPITIGVGPGFDAGNDVDLVIESNRGHDLGKLILKGKAQLNTGVPGNIAGFTKERVIKSPCEGRIKTINKIGDLVTKGQIIAEIESEPVKAKIDGVLRGLIMNNTYIKKDTKIGDVDPRGIREYCFTISEKARAIGGGVLEGILYMKRMKKYGI